jgi:hypothetical protein
MVRQENCLWIYLSVVSAPTQAIGTAALCLVGAILHGDKIITLTHNIIAVLNWVRECQVRRALVLKKTSAKFSIVSLQILKRQ